MGLAEGCFRCPWSENVRLLTLVQRRVIFGLIFFFCCGLVRAKSPHNTSLFDWRDATSPISLALSRPEQNQMAASFHYEETETLDVKKSHSWQMMRWRCPARFSNQKHIFSGATRLINTASDRGTGLSGAMAIRLGLFVDHTWWAEGTQRSLQFALHSAVNVAYITLYKYGFSSRNCLVAKRCRLYFGLAVPPTPAVTLAVNVAHSISGFNVTSKNA